MRKIYFLIQESNLYTRKSKLTHSCMKFQNVIFFFVKWKHKKNQKKKLFIIKFFRLETFISFFMWWKVNKKWGKVRTKKKIFWENENWIVITRATKWTRAMKIIKSYFVICMSSEQCRSKEGKKEEFFLKAYLREETFQIRTQIIMQIFSFKKSSHYTLCACVGSRQQKKANKQNNHEKNTKF